MDSLAVEFVGRVDEVVTGDGEASRSRSRCIAHPLDGSCGLARRSSRPLPSSPSDHWTWNL